MAFLYPPGVAYVETLLGVMAAGGLAVPLSPLHTRPELEQLLSDAGPIRVLCAPQLRDHLPAALPCPLDLAAPATPASAVAPVADDADALMLFTSGTTGRPKGVVSSHAALAACAASLHEAWGWRADDRLLHVLPLHHTHGVVVALLGALWAGASVRFGDAQPLAIWRRVRPGLGVHGRAHHPRPPAGSLRRRADPTTRPASARRPPGCGWSPAGRRRCPPRCWRASPRRQATGCWSVTG